MEGNILLLDALKKLVAALENDSIDYNYKYKSMNNVGLLAQAITGTNRESLYDIYLEDLDKEYKSKYSGHLPSWTGLISDHWPLTSEPTNKLFKMLYDSGLTREDVSSLEYLSDYRILKDSGINPVNWIHKYTEIKTKGWWIFKKQVPVEKMVEMEFFRSKENLLLYLRSWLNILKTPKLKSKEIIVAGERFTYKNRADLDRLQKHFLKYEIYEGVEIVQEKLNEY
mgnify:CR=1 FL=1